MDSAIPAVAMQMGVTQLGTFDQRQGGQLLLDGDGWMPAGWARVLSTHNNQQQSGGATPRFDGNIEGAQVGHDIFVHESENGQGDHFGAFVGYTHANGLVDGSDDGFSNVRAGGLHINGDSVGAYWTHVTEARAYIDVVLMGTWFHTHVDSSQHFDDAMHGSSFSASLEGGVPIALTSHLALEPQAQAIFQHITMDGFQDPVSSVAFSSINAATGRLGGRLLGRFSNETQTLEPYLKLNLWRNFHRNYNTVFAGEDVVPANLASTAVELGGGVSATLTPRLSVYGDASYLRNIDSLHRRGATANLGLRLLWGAPH